MRLFSVLRPNRRARAALRLLLCAAVLALAHASARAAPLEYEVKAAFVYNFAKFVEWPSDNTPLRLCVLGKDAIAPALAEIQGKPVKARKIEVALLDATADTRGCDLLFISLSAEKHLDRVAALSRGSGMLTIGDSEGFAQRGVMMNLFTENGKIRFEVNLDAIRRSGVKVSSKLLALGKILDFGQDR